MLDYIKAKLAALDEEREQKIQGEQTLDALAELCQGFNRVNAWQAPNGDVILCLSHRHCNDQDVLIRVRSTDDVIFTEFRDWDEDEQLSRLNHGGNWGGRHDA